MSADLRSGSSPPFHWFILIIPHGCSLVKANTGGTSSLFHAGTSSLFHALWLYAFIRRTFAGELGHYLGLSSARSSRGLQGWLYLSPFSRGLRPFFSRCGCTPSFNVHSRVNWVFIWGYLPRAHRAGCRVGFTQNRHNKNSRPSHNSRES